MEIELDANELQIHRPDLNSYTAFCRVLTASPSEANQIREQQLRWMRPENNPAYLTANHASRALRE